MSKLFGCWDYNILSSLIGLLRIKHSVITHCLLWINIFPNSLCCCIIWFIAATRANKKRTFKQVIYIWVVLLKLYIVATYTKNIFHFLILFLYLYTFCIFYISFRIVYKTIVNYLRKSFQFLPLEYSSTPTKWKWISWPAFEPATSPPEL